MYWTINRLSSFALLMSFVMSFSGASLKAQVPETLKVPKTTDFTVTGEGQAKNWDQAAWTTLPARKNADHYKTQAKVLYSNTGIYFLLQCEDAKINSTYNQHNADLWKEDVVEVFLWTDERFPIYFEYELSPMNYELNLLVPNIDKKFLGWIPWHYDDETRKVQHGTSVTGGEKKSNAAIISWTAEFFIPFELLKPLGNVPPQKGTQWRANMYRMDYDRVHSVWSWQVTDKTFHEYEKFGNFLFD